MDKAGAVVAKLLWCVVLVCGSNNGNSCRGSSDSSLSGWWQRQAAKAVVRMIAIAVTASSTVVGSRGTSNSSEWHLAPSSSCGGSKNQNQHKKLVLVL